MPLNVGDRSPDFETLTDTGEKFKLSDFVGKSNIILYFYPKDNTPGCTAEACSFRDNWDRLGKFDVVVLGVSSDTQTSHSSFREKYKLPFTLLTDENKRIRSLYGATGRLIPPRITFIIDKQGIIRHVYNSQLKPGNHVEEAVRALNEIEGKHPEAT